MNIEHIVLELLDRIKILENKVSELEKNKIEDTFIFSTNEDKEISLTQRARDYINGCKRMAMESKADSLFLRCNDIQKDLGVTNRAASICQAMYDCMQPGDEVIEAPKSGKSTTVTIEYKLGNMKSFEDKDESCGEDSRSISVRQLRTGFEYYFKNKKPEYKYPGPLFGMAFYISRHNIGVTFEDMFSGKVTLNEYEDILYNLFNGMNSTNPSGRASAYKDAMKNLLEYVHDMHYENVKIENN